MTMHRVNQTFVAIVAALCIGLSACSREQRDWRSAQAADSLESYDQFLQFHPDSELAAQARSRLLQLTEERDWQRASTTDTADAYKQFLNQHGSGKRSAEARIRLENFSLEGQSVNVPANPVATVRPAPVATASAPISTQTPSTAATPSAATTTAPHASANSFGIQLGAFSSESKANAEWQRLQQAFADELGALQPHIVAATTSAGDLFRLQSLVENESKARAVCAALAAKSQGCVVVLPQH